MDTKKLNMILEPTRREVLTYFIFPNSPATVARSMHKDRDTITNHVIFLHRAGLLEKLPREVSPFDSNRKSKYQAYALTAEGKAILDGISGKMGIYEQTTTPEVKPKSAPELPKPEPEQAEPKPKQEPPPWWLKPWLKKPEP